MFDFIEEPIVEEAKKVPTMDDPLDGTVYTMPSHRTSSVASGEHSPAGLIVGIIATVVFVCGTGVAIWWFEFRPASEATVSKEIAVQTEEPIVQSAPNEEDVILEPDDTGSLEESPDVLTDVIIPSPPTPPILNYVGSVDTDGDDLTDTEEALFQSDPLQPDTDQDGHLDGEEVTFLYDPLRIAPAKLETGTGTATYTNPGYSYKLLYPSGWVVDSVDNARREVIFSSATGEFVSITAQDNLEKLSALDWFSTVYQPNVDTSSLQTMSYDTWTGVMSSDGLNVYITSKDDQGNVVTPYVYVVKYDLGSKNIMSFGTVFQMMIRGFVITDLSF
ncbi:MAG: hypothetical protein Q8P11_00845 [bacterium]|nr:hypothetical protein [bacterium]